MISPRSVRSRGLNVLTGLLLTALAPVMAHSQPPVALDHGLVAHLAFENNLFATGIGGVEGRAVGNVGYDHGVIGSALALHGDDCVEVTDSPAMHSEKLSLCAWVCPRGEHSYGRIAEKGSSDSFWLNLYDNKVRFGFLSDRFHEVDSGSSLKANEWAFVTGTYDGQALRVYVNGELEGLVVIRQKPRFNEQPLVIGWKHGGVPTDHFVGWIDEVRLYDRALTLAEVQKLSAPVRN